MPRVWTADERSEVIAGALKRLDEGASLLELAAEAGVSGNTLRRWLLMAGPERFREAQAAGLVAQIVEADEDLERATTHLDVSKHDKRAKLARWNAERRLPKMFAQRTEITGAEGAPLIPTDLGEVARRLAFVLASTPAGEVIDVEPLTEKAAT